MRYGVRPDAHEIRRRTVRVLRPPQDVRSTVAGRPASACHGAERYGVEGPL